MPVDLELLDLVGAVGLGGDEDGHDEDFAAGVQLAQRVFHVGAGGLVGDVEGPGRVGVEEGLDDLAGLGLAGVAGRFGADTGTTATFSGISWYSDEALARIRDGEFDIREFWKQEIAAGRAPFVDMSQLHATWIDMGSPEGLMAAVEARLVECGRDKNEAVVEPGVVIPDGVKIAHSVIFKGAEIQPGETIENEIRGKGFRWIVNAASS